MRYSDVPSSLIASYANSPETSAKAASLTSDVSTIAKVLFAPTSPTSTSQRPFGENPVGAGAASSANAYSPAKLSCVIARPVFASVQRSVVGDEPSSE